MNKYELALVLNAKVEDDVRTATLEKVKGLVERFNGTITNVDEWGKKKLAYEIQKMSWFLFLVTGIVLILLAAFSKQREMRLFSTSQTDLVNYSDESRIWSFRSSL